MASETINYDAWRAREAQRRAKIKRIPLSAEKTPRTRPRAAAEADFLRRIGTPEHLIGPVMD